MDDTNLLILLIEYWNYCSQFPASCQVDGVSLIVYSVYIRHIRLVNRKMNISVSHSSGVPIYQQIKDQLQQQILSGQLQDGELLPSIRSLAQTLQISVITTKRAYDDLEQEGLVASVSGKGTFVSHRNAEAIREARYRRLEEQLKAVVAESRALGLPAEELAQLVHVFYGEEPV